MSALAEDVWDKCLGQSHAKSIIKFVMSFTVFSHRQGLDIVLKSVWALALGCLQLPAWIWCCIFTSKAILLIAILCPEFKKKNNPEYKKPTKHKNPKFLKMCLLFRFNGLDYRYISIAYTYWWVLILQWLKCSLQN